MAAMGEITTKHPYVIGVCGRTCSGKSTVVAGLEQSLPNVLHIKQDKFFKLPHDKSINWESPDALRNDQLIYSIKRLKDNLPAHIPSHAWTEDFDREIYPKDYIVIEGYLLFAVDELYPLFDKRIWIDVSDEVLVKRRQNRAGNGRLDDIEYVKNVVIPCSKQYEPIQRSRAHIVIDGNRNKDEVIDDFKRLVLGGINI